MIGFLRGIIFSFGFDYLLLDVNGVGYRISFYHPEALSVGKEILIFTYQNSSEYETNLYGFLSEDEYDLFVKLISVKGLGPKIASGILAKFSPNSVIEAIENEDITFMKRLPGIGNKTASQIILDLKGKLINPDNNINEASNQRDEDIFEALKALGYKVSEIKPIIKKLPPELGVDEGLKEALKMLMR